MTEPTGDEVGSPAFDVVRTLALSDGVFAISLTLLVLALVVPPGLATADDVNVALRTLVPDLFALALSFLVIGRYWIGHHQLFKLIEGADVPLLWLNLLFLVWIALMPFTTDLLAAYGQYAVPTIVYAANISAAALTSGAIHWWVLHQRHGTVLSPADSGSLDVAVAFLASIPVAALGAPDWAKVAWLSVPLVGAVGTRFRRSRGTAGR